MGSSFSCGKASDTDSDSEIEFELPDGWKEPVSASQLSFSFVSSCVRLSPETSTKTMSLPSITRVSQAHHSSCNSITGVSVHNGIVPNFISSRMGYSLAKFYKHNIDQLDKADQLELACCIYFSMTSDKDVNSILFKSRTAKHSNATTIEQMSLKLLEMIKWLLYHLMITKIDLHASLQQLGKLHCSMGITAAHYVKMLAAIHATFEHYFPQTYCFDIRYAVDEVFAVAASIMAGQDMKRAGHVASLDSEPSCDSCAHDSPLTISSKNLRSTLACKLGREYFYTFLTRKMCEETAIFIKAVTAFREAASHAQRLQWARDIQKICFDPSSDYCLNISHALRESVTQELLLLEKDSADNVHIEKDLYKDVEEEVFELLTINLWTKFVRWLHQVQADCAHLYVD